MVAGGEFADGVGEELGEGGDTVAAGERAAGDGDDVAVRLLDRRADHQGIVGRQGGGGEEADAPAGGDELADRLEAGRPQGASEGALGELADLQGVVAQAVALLEQKQLAGVELVQPDLILVGQRIVFG